MRIATAATAFILTALPAMASDYQAVRQSYLDGDIRSWAQSPVLVEAISGQSNETHEFDQGKIIALDTKWCAEVGTIATPVIDKVLQNAAADFLRFPVTESDGRITEVFIKDAQGLNVAASETTTDMWQGDGAKFRMTYPLDTRASHFGDVELDDSSRRYLGQISLIIVDPTSGSAIGAMTDGIDADALM